MLYAVGESELTNHLVNPAAAFSTETVERFRSGDGSHVGGKQNAHRERRPMPVGKRFEPERAVQLLLQA